MMALRRTAAESERSCAAFPAGAPESRFIVAKVIRARYPTHRCGANVRIVCVESPALFPGVCFKVEAKPVGDALRFRIVVFSSQAVKHFVGSVKFVAGGL